MIRKSQCDIIESAFHVAKLWAELRSKGNTKVGAAVVHIESGHLFLGYNGFPHGIIDEDDLWKASFRHDIIVHAEPNAMRKAIATLGLPLIGCVMVSTMLPCLSCMKEIYAAGIRDIVYESDTADILKTEDPFARHFFTSLINIRRIEPKLGVTCALR